MPGDDREQIRELLSQGLSTDAVAARLGASKGTVAAIKAHMTMGTYTAGARGRGGGIYMRQGGDLIALTETPYETEDVLQALLADHPGLLAGDELGDTPRRWVLLSREVRVADAEGRPGRWSLDHLFIDQDGIPTLVEVKRSSDTRIRREVVGQLLEYAANGVHHWPIEQLRALFEASCVARGTDPDTELGDALGDDADIEDWWAQVATNLRLGKLRLVFVADAISRELRRIIEFLNEQMTQTEVIGVEIRQYVDSTGEHQTLVPRLIGQTEAARDVKRRSASVRRYEVSVADLIDAGLIPPEGTLTSHYRGGGHEAHYTREAVEHAGTVHRSPSKAAKAAIGRNVNGWDFWFVDGHGGKRSLAEFRAEYVRDHDAR